MTQPRSSEVPFSFAEALLATLEAGTSLLDMIARLLGEEHLTHFLQTNEILLLYD